MSPSDHTAITHPNRCSLETVEGHSTPSMHPRRPALSKLIIPPYTPSHVAGQRNSPNYGPPKLKRMAVPQRLWVPLFRTFPLQNTPDSPTIPPITFDLVGSCAPYGLPIPLVTSRLESTADSEFASLVQNADDVVLEKFEKIFLRILVRNGHFIQLFTFLLNTFSFLD